MQAIMRVYTPMMHCRSALCRSECEESGITYITGELFFAPKGVRYGPHVARTEVISLTILDGPLTVV